MIAVKTIMARIACYVVMYEYAVAGGKTLDGFSDCHDLPCRLVT